MSAALIPAAVLGGLAFVLIVAKAIGSAAPWWETTRGEIESLAEVRPIEDEAES